MRFEIDRAKWRNGGDGENRKGKGLTLLENEEGFCCGLGFCMKQLFPQKEMIGAGFPKQLMVESPFSFKQYSLFYSTNLAKEAIIINDDEYTTSEEKERQLTELFSEHNHEIVFIGEYP